MKIVNKSNVPELIYKFLEQDFYDYAKVRGTTSVTTLLKPIQEIVLTERHSNEIEIDAADRLWTVFGSAVHEVLSKIKGEDIKQEERVYTKILDERVSGKFDVINKNRIYDYKVTSAWTIAYRSRDEDWKRQLSLYRWIYWKEKNIFLDNIGYVIAILKDWSENQVSGKYPKTPIVQLEYILDSVQDVEKYVEGRIKEIQTARDQEDIDLPWCTDKERWWNEKKGEYIKCKKYCLVRDFCFQNKVDMKE